MQKPSIYATAAVVIAALGSNPTMAASDGMNTAAPLEPFTLSSNQMDQVTAGGVPSYMYYSAADAAVIGLTLACGATAPCAFAAGAYGAYKFAQPFVEDDVYRIYRQR